MNEEQLRQIIRSEMITIHLHLLAISQKLEAVPWQHRYTFGTNEPEFPPRVLLNMRYEQDDPISSSAVEG